jgi:hypothetical protein
VLEEKKIKVNGIAGVVGFVLSFIVGIISGGNLLIVLLRALIFGVLFFVFMEIFQRLISTFLPELLNPDADVSSVAGEVPGSRVDISVEDKKGDLFDVSGALEQNDLASRGESFADDVEALDQNHKKDYTQQKEVEADPTSFVPSAPWSKDQVQGMDGAVGRDPWFSTDAAIPGNLPRVALSTGQNNSNVQSTGKNLDPKKMASAIQTILKQE